MTDIDAAAVCQFTGKTTKRQKHTMDGFREEQSLSHCQIDNGSRNVSRAHANEDVSYT